MFIKLLKLPLFVIMFIAILCNLNLVFANQDLVASITPNINYAFEGQAIEFTASAEGKEGTLSFDWSEQNGVGGTLNKKTYTMPSVDNSPLEISCTITDTKDSVIKGSDIATENITIIEFDALQYEQPIGTWNDINGTLYILKGSTITFKAVPNPATATWPNEQPVWGGTSGASGFGETKTITFNTTSATLNDYKTIDITLDNTETANIVVYDLTPTLTPKDDFNNRSQTKYGLEEQVDLNCTITPANMTASLAGGLEWTKHNGEGIVNNANNVGVATYDAKHVVGNVELRLTVQAGPSKDQFKSYTKTIIAPSGTRMTRVTSNVKHTQGVASAGIALYYWLDPKDVSFKFLNFGEGSCLATGSTGIYITHPPGNHTINTFGSILGGNATTGCRVDSMDGAYTGYSSWAPGGTYTWSIPAQYIDDTATRHNFGNNQNHVPRIFVNGDTTMSKGGQSGTAALNAPSSGY